jgi:hypothetical protein
MLSLTAILRVWMPQGAEANDLLAEPQARLGFSTLTIIALVIVFLTFWRG